MVHDPPLPVRATSPFYLIQTLSALLRNRFALPCELTLPHGARCLYGYAPH